jgi:hydroxyacylglutathione hydrolase
MMWRSLCKLRDLPNDTKIYCGHEYTAANIKFARTIEPNNAALIARETQAQQQIAQGKPTIPVTIGEEKLANPFLRADLPEVAADIGMAAKHGNACSRRHRPQSLSQAASGRRPLP